MFQTIVGSLKVYEGLRINNYMEMATNATFNKPFPHQCHKHWTWQDTRQSKLGKAELQFGLQEFGYCTKGITHVEAYFAVMTALQDFWGANVFTHLTNPMMLHNELIRSYLIRTQRTGTGTAIYSDYSEEHDTRALLEPVTNCIMNTIDPDEMLVGNVSVAPRAQDLFHRHLQGFVHAVNVGDTATETLFTEITGHASEAFFEIESADASLSGMVLDTEATNTLFKIHDAEDDEDIHEVNTQILETSKPWQEGRNVILRRIPF